MENLFTRENFDVELFQSVTGVKITDVPEDLRGVLLKDIKTDFMDQLVSEYRDMLSSEDAYKLDIILKNPNKIMKLDSNENDLSTRDMEMYNSYIKNMVSLTPSVIEKMKLI